MNTNLFLAIGEWFSTFASQMRLFRFTDVLDILTLTVIYFWIFRFIRQRRGARLLISIAGMVALMVVSTLLEMSAVSYILQSIFQVGFIALIILFQPELRSALERMSEEPFGGTFRFLRRRKNMKEEEGAAMIKEICDAAADLSRSRTGALMVIERTAKLQDIISSGVTLDAKLSSYLLRNIFYLGAPMHDGAVIIREGRICAAGCFLPLTEQYLDLNLGTRHRAALGMSEQSDAVVVVVSEETGSVSLAYDGRLVTDYTYPTLQKRLTDLLLRQGDAARTGKKK